METSASPNPANAAVALSAGLPPSFVGPRASGWRLALFASRFPLPRDARASSKFVPFIAGYQPQ